MNNTEKISTCLSDDFLNEFIEKNNKINVNDIKNKLKYYSGKLKDEAYNATLKYQNAKLIYETYIKIMHNNKEMIQKLHDTYINILNASNLLDNMLKISINYDTLKDY
jgi:hypothetical protein